MQLAAATARPLLVPADERRESHLGFISSCDAGSGKMEASFPTRQLPCHSFYWNMRAFQQIQKGFASEGSCLCCLFPVVDAGQCCDSAASCTFLLILWCRRQATLTQKASQSFVAQMADLP